ncbi:brca1 c terminus domain-containing protein, partial [Cystoisospora suis]
CLKFFFFFGLFALLRDRGGERRKFAVVTVNWIFQCIDSGKLVPVGDYLPEVLQVRSRFASSSIDSFYARKEKKPLPSSFSSSSPGEKSDRKEEVLNGSRQETSHDCLSLEGGRNRSLPNHGVGREEKEVHALSNKEKNDKEDVRGSFAISQEDLGEIDDFEDLAQQEDSQVTDDKEKSSFERRREERKGFRKLEGEEDDESDVTDSESRLLSSREVSVPDVQISRIFSRRPLEEKIHTEKAKKGDGRQTGEVKDHSIGEERKGDDVGSPCGTLLSSYSSCAKEDPLTGKEDCRDRVGGDGIEEERDFIDTNRLSLVKEVEQEEEEEQQIKKRRIEKKNDDVDGRERGASYITIEKSNTSHGIHTKNQGELFSSSSFSSSRLLPSLQSSSPLSSSSLLPSADLTSHADGPSIPGHSSSSSSLVSNVFSREETPTLALPSSTSSLSSSSLPVFPSHCLSSTSSVYSTSSSSSPRGITSTFSSSDFSPQSLSCMNRTSKTSLIAEGRGFTKKSEERGGRIVNAQDPSFVATFFENSRLHFIGRWKVRCMDILASILRHEKERKFHLTTPITTGEIKAQPPLSPSSALPVPSLSSSSSFSPSPSVSWPLRSQHFHLEDVSSLRGSLLSFLLPLSCTPPTTLDVAVSAEAAATDPGFHKAGKAIISSSRGGALERLLVRDDVHTRAFHKMPRDKRHHYLGKEKRKDDDCPQTVLSWEKERNKLSRYLFNSAMRWIIHVDFDAFFVAVALKKHPHLKDSPVAVSHSRGSRGRMGGSTSEVASCNYIARARGVYKGQWLGEAKALCPDLIALPYDFEGIEEATRGLFKCILTVSRRILPVSCDEAYLQVLLYFRHPSRQDLSSVSSIPSSSSSSSPAGIPGISSCSREEKMCIKEAIEGQKSGDAERQELHENSRQAGSPGEEEERKEESMKKGKLNRKGMVSRDEEKEEDVRIVEREEEDEENTLLKEAQDSILKICIYIREMIFKTTGCWVSVGAGPNLLTAKLAGLRAKPNHTPPPGEHNTSTHHSQLTSTPSSSSFSSSPSSSPFSSSSVSCSSSFSLPSHARSACPCLEAEGVCVVSLDESSVQEFMKDLPLKKLPGVGPVVLDQVLKQGGGGMATCGDVMKRRLRSLRTLQQLLGK